MCKTKQHRARSQKALSVKAPRNKLKILRQSHQQDYGDVITVKLYFPAMRTDSNMKRQFIQVTSLDASVVGRDSRDWPTVGLIVILLNTARILFFAY